MSKRLTVNAPTERLAAQVVRAELDHQGITTGPLTVRPTEQQPDDSVAIVSLPSDGTGPTWSVVFDVAAD